MIEFFAMGGYGAYIWPSYIISAIIIGVFGFFRYRNLKKLRQRVNDNTNKSETQPQ